MLLLHPLKPYALGGSIAASQGYPLGDVARHASAKYQAAYSGYLCELIESTTVAFDDAVVNLFQVDILQDDGAAVSTFKHQRPSRADRLSACDL
jgi:hypothetical protein